MSGLWGQLPKNGCELAINWILCMDTSENLVEVELDMDLDV